MPDPDVVWNAPPCFGRRQQCASRDTVVQQGAGEGFASRSAITFGEEWAFTRGLSGNPERGYPTRLFHFPPWARYSLEKQSSSRPRGFPTLRRKSGAVSIVYRANFVSTRASAPQNWPSSLLADWARGRAAPRQDPSLYRLKSYERPDLLV